MLRPLSPDSKLFEKKLHHSEELLWVGRPLQGPIRRKVDALTIFLILLAEVVIWGAAHVYDLLFVQHNIVGLLFIAAPFLLIFRALSSDRKERDHTCYAVTSERIIVLNDYAGRTRELSFTSIKGVKVVGLKDGRGSIVFNDTLPTYIVSTRNKYATKKDPPPASEGFTLIENPEEVADLIGKRLKRGPKTDRKGRVIEG